MRHNPQSFYFRGQRVGIVEERRSDVGDLFATVMDYFWREDTPWLVLRLPDGRRASAPAAWTDFPADTFLPSGNRPLLLARALPPMARMCQRLQSTRPVPRRPRK